MRNNHVLFISADHDQEVKGILSEQGLQVTWVDSMHKLKGLDGLDRHGLVLLDLDLPDVDNNSIFRLKKKIGQAWIIGFSSRTYHPHLKESLRSCMFAVLGKPADAEELLYCLRSLLEK